MQSNNPVLSRYEKQPAGFAYSEGQSAYAAASGQAPGSVPPASTDEQFQTITAASGVRLTLNDVIVKTGMLFAIVVVLAVVGWNLVLTAPLLVFGAAIIGMVLGFVNALKREVSPPLVMLYAAAQGLLLGGISNMYNQIAVGNGWEGIVVQAVVATMVTFGVMLTLFATGIVKVTKKFTAILMVAAISYLVIGLISLVSSFFGVGNGWGIYGMGDFGILVAFAGVLIAAFFLMLDFEAIRQGIAMGAPERESWRMAFGLLVTLIWIYLEFLRLLALLSGRE